MSHAIDEQPFPRGFLVAAGALIGFSILVAAVARITDLGAARLPPSPVVSSRLLTFKLAPDGSVQTHDVLSGQSAPTVPAHGFGFVRVVLDGVARERMRANVPLGSPLLLTVHADGSTRLEDPQTGQIVSLGAFGHSNQAAFAQLLANERTGL